MKTSSPRAAVAKYPPAEVASDESGTATLHGTDLGTRADETTWVYGARGGGRRFMRMTRKSGSGSGGDECEKAEEVSFHFFLDLIARFGFM